MKLADIRIIGVVGAGAMGHGIALSFALWNYPTVMHDVSDENLQTAMGRIRSALGEFGEEGLISSKQAEAAIDCITPTTDFSVLARESDYICEAIVEKSKEKRRLFKELDEASGPATILASNTSSLILSDFGSEVKRQDKILVTHYFNPPYIIPCVEVVKGPGTSEETFDLTYQLLERVKKVPIRVRKELPGYLINRIQYALWREVFDLWGRGVASAEDIDRAVKASFGFRLPSIGPLMTLDLSGVLKWGSVVYDMFARMYKEICNDEEPPQKVKDLMLACQNFHDYSPERWDEIKKLRDREFLRRLVREDWSKVK
jgi:3-hydroxybutyryl-CoA dehydrogenase